MRFVGGDEGLTSLAGVDQLEELWETGKFMLMSYL